MKVETTTESGFKFEKTLQSAIPSLKFFWTPCSQIDPSTPIERHLGPLLVGIATATRISTPGPGPESCFHSKTDETQAFHVLSEFVQVWTHSIGLETQDQQPLEMQQYFKNLQNILPQCLIPPVPHSSTVLWAVTKRFSVDFHWFF